MCSNKNGIGSKDKLTGLVLNLERLVVKIMLFCADKHVKEGFKCLRTHKLVNMIVGPHLLGRVVDIFGNVINCVGFNNAVDENMLGCIF